MKITITEALQLKNELKQKVAQATYEMNNCLYVRTEQNGVDITSTTPTFEENFTKLKKVLDNSQELNDAISQFNMESKVSNYVREQKNLLVLIAQVQNAIKKSVQTSVTQMQVVGAERVAVTTVLTPIINASELTKSLNFLKTRNRELFALIQKANTQEIELSFSYEDVE
jgi:hypothetical protein